MKNYINRAVKQEVAFQLRQQRTKHKNAHKPSISREVRIAMGPNTRIKPGRIFRVENSRGSLNGKYVTVTGINSGFYFYISDDRGRPDRQTKGRVYHSNIFHREDLYHSGDIRLTQVRKGRYKWYLTGHLVVDMYMANLDGGQYRYFRDKAPIDLQNEYDQLTNRNDHTEAGKLVYDFANS